MVAKLAAVLGLAITVGVGVDVVPAFAAAAWLTVDTGGAHACGIQQDGSLWCWGANESGQLGLGDTTDRSVPTQVGTRLDWASVAAGSSPHLCTDHLRPAVLLGFQRLRQLGLNNTTGTTTPARRPRGTPHLAVHHIRRRHHLRHHDVVGPLLLGQQRNSGNRVW